MSGEENDAILISSCSEKTRSSRRRALSASHIDTRNTNYENSVRSRGRSVLHSNYSDYVIEKSIELPTWLRRTQSSPFIEQNLNDGTAVVAAIQAFIGDHWQRYTDIRDILRSSSSQQRPDHSWDRFIGKRHSNRRNFLQFLLAIFIGLVFFTVAAPSIEVLKPDNILRLDGDIDSEGEIIREFNDTIILIPDRTDLELSVYATSTNKLEFSLIVMGESQYISWFGGGYLTDYLFLKLNTSSAILDSVFVDNQHEELFYVIICPSIQVACNNNSIPFPRYDERAWNTSLQMLTASYRIEVEANCCLCDGEYTWLLVFLPLILAIAHTFHIFQLVFCLKRIPDLVHAQTEAERMIPDHEVDYWQPIPWDRKCPKINALFPFLWKELRRPKEPFYTWWRHENNFTWIFFPYRHERLSRWERMLIIYASWLVMFYVSFYLTVGSASLTNSTDKLLGRFQPFKVYIIQIIPQPLVKAIFKEIFKLFYRARRKRNRDRTETWYCNYYTSNIGSMIVLTIVHLPIADVLLSESCAYVRQFFKFFGVAQLLRLSIVALLLDWFWYMILYVFGYQDLCPSCTDRLRKCACFNDELLVVAVAKFGSRWKLIKQIDKVLSEIAGEHGIEYEEQFSHYSSYQLKQRWEILVQKAKRHIEMVKEMRFAIGVRSQFLRLSGARMSSSRVCRASFHFDPQDSSGSLSTCYIPDTIIEEKILAINETLNPEVADLPDNVICTQEFLDTLQDVNLANSADTRRQLSLMQENQRREAFQSLDKNSCHKYFRIGLRSLKSLLEIDGR